MKMAHSTAVDVSHGISREDLQQFVDTIPAVAKITARVDTQTADRPYESSRTSVKLQAEWTT